MSFNKIISQQRQYMKEALSRLEEIESWERMLNGVDEKFIQEKTVELSVEYAIAMTMLVKISCDELGFELKEKRKLNSLFEIAQIYAT